MNIRTLLSAVAVAAFVAGCNKDEAKGGDAKGAATSEAAAAKSESTGVKECDDYLSTLEKCLKNAPAEAKAAQEAALKTARDNYKPDAAPEVKRSWVATCKQSADLLANNPFCK